MFLLCSWEFGAGNEGMWHERGDLRRQEMLHRHTGDFGQWPRWQQPSVHSCQCIDHHLRSHSSLIYCDDTRWYVLRLLKSKVLEYSGMFVWLFYGVCYSNGGIKARTQNLLNPIDSHQLPSTGFQLTPRTLWPLRSFLGMCLLKILRSIYKIVKLTTDFTPNLVKFKSRKPWEFKNMILYH